ncbi:MAG TPA: hypothetical protein VNL15_07320, partial [Dehalococcoidia bacterium]|nr:hypothetical protein [Dehalococcoidia bacterium]
DGSGSLLDSVDSTESLTANWPGFRYLTTGPVQAPPEARSAKLRLMAVTLSGPGRVFYDSVSFNETTAPEGGEGSGGTSATSGRNRTGGAASRRAESPLAQASQLNRLLNFSGLEGILAGRSGPHSLANVKPAREDKADTSGGSDRSTILLGLTVPGPSLALAFLGYRYWRGRRSLIAPR